MTAGHGATYAYSRPLSSERNSWRLRLPQVGILVGSASDKPVMEDTLKTLTDLGVEAELVVASAHRDPEKVRAYVLGAAERGIEVAIDEVGRDLPTVLRVRVASGNPPDLAALPNPGQMKEFANKGNLVALDDLTNLADHPKAFVDLVL